MPDWSFLGGLFGSLQVYSPMLGRLWLLLMLVFRMLVLGTVASDMFDDEQEEFSCNTLQPGCKQVCYDQAFPISQYRFWVFHIVLISTPSLVFLVYAMHHHHPKRHQSNAPEGAGRRLKRRLRWLYGLSVSFRLVTELGFLMGQWLLYGFRVNARFQCSRFPCPHTVDCFTSRPMEKTVFLLFYFAVGVVSALSSLAELAHIGWKWYWADAGEPAPSYSDFKELQGKSDKGFSGQELTLESGGSAEGVLLPPTRPGKRMRSRVKGSKGRTVPVRHNNATKRSSIKLKRLRRSKSQKSASLLV